MDYHIPRKCSQTNYSPAARELFYLFCFSQDVLSALSIFDSKKMASLNSDGLPFLEMILLAHFMSIMALRDMLRPFRVNEC